MLTSRRHSSTGFSSGPDAVFATLRAVEGAFWRKSQPSFTAVELRQSKHGNSGHDRDSSLLRFWVAVINGQKWKVTTSQPSDPEKPLKNPSDAGLRCFADVFINFVYPAFLFMVFPVFVARSSSYMDAISIATGVFFAIQWDAESADIELKPDGSPLPNRSEA